MLMRRILLKVGRGVRRRISQLGSCLHTPGADQSSVKHSVSNAFLLSHDSSNQLHHSMFCDRGFLTWSRSKQRQAFRVQCVSTFGTVLTNLYESLLLLMFTCVLTPVLGFVHASCLWPCFHPTSQRKNPGPGTVNHSEVSTCARPVRTPKLFPLSSEERHQKET